MQNIDIFIITYNRKKYIERTLNLLFAEDSPIKDWAITVLDNASTDGTSEFLESFCSVHKNLSYIKNVRNIGGNANIVRAYELSLNKNCEYVWVLCDDDLYDFSSWAEIQKAIDDKYDIICVCNYAFPEEEEKIFHIPNLLLQLTFVPAGIYKKSLFKDDVFPNMYDAISSLFPQSVISIEAINNGKRIYEVKNEIVHNGIFYDKKERDDLSYTRGKKHSLKRTSDMTWILGFSNVITLIDNKVLRQNAIENVFNHNDLILPGGIDNFLNFELKKHVLNGNIHYVSEIEENLCMQTKKKIEDKIKSYNNCAQLFGFKRRCKNFIRIHFPAVFKLLKKLKKTVLHSK